MCILYTKTEVVFKKYSSVLASKNSRPYKKCSFVLQQQLIVFVFHSEEKAIELYKQLKAKCKSECV